MLNCGTNKIAQLPAIPYNSSCAGLAHQVERMICNHQVAGSSPAAGTFDTFDIFRRHPVSKALYRKIKALFDHTSSAIRLFQAF
jgi:hypothetical protein